MKRQKLIVNTIIMYVRTVFTMAISFYTSRLVLNILGETDFGLYFVVAGVVSIFSFLNSSLSTSTQRFLNFELGKEGGKKNLNPIFSASLKIHILLATILFFLAETVGLWFLNTHMTIPDARMWAANIVYQFSIFSTMVMVVQVPYSSTIIAFENFRIFALFDILQAVLRLITALILISTSWDRLAYYGALIFGVTLAVAIGKVMYCRRQYDFCFYRSLADNTLVFNLGRFAGWNIIGALTVVLNTQGVGVLLNVFFGPVLNAAQGIAVQLANATSTLASNLQITSSPQIVKAYSAGENKEFFDLVMESSKFCFYSMLVSAAPVIINMEFLLDIWLDKIPPNAVEIGQVLLFTALVNSFSFPLMAAVQSTGNIRNYQLVVGGFMLLAIPVGYIVLKSGYGPLSVFWVLFVMSIVGLIARIYILRSLVQLKCIPYAKKVFLPAAKVSVIVFGLSHLIGNKLTGSFFMNVLMVGVTFFISVISIWIAGISKKDREIVYKKMKAKLF